MRPAELTNEPDEVTCRDCQRALVSNGMCSFCGGTRLFWDWAAENAGSACDGRLRLSEIRTVFYLACEECSETLLILRAGQVAEHLTKTGWRS